MRFHAVIFAIALSPFAFAYPSHGQAPVPDSPAIEQRVDALLKKMSITEKLSLLGGEDTFFIRAVPSISLPKLRMADGPVGVRNWGPSTTYPASIALAATWNTDLAEQVGRALGSDCRARGVHILLAPGVNLYRTSLNGRNMEYMGEDPILAGKMAVAYIHGLQSKGVMATVKHLAANNSEFDRHNSNSVIDERTLRELYLTAFEMAVKDGKVAAVMDSYNLLNGEHLTQNRHINIDILKKEWGFDGILMSDWDATYDGVAAANAGLDLEMPGAKWMSVQTLSEALKDGRVSQATIDDKVRRILRTAIRFGFLDREQLDAGIPSMNPETAQVALEEAIESIVLLKNEKSLLPLDISKQKNIVVIGPNAFPAITGGGGSSKAIPFSAESLVEGISDYVGKRGVVRYIGGLTTSEKFFHETRFTEMKQSIYAGASTEGSPEKTNSVTRIETWREGEQSSEVNSISKGTYTFVWKGKYVPAFDGEYVLAGLASRNDHYTIAIDGKTVIETDKKQGKPFPAHTILSLQKDKPVAIEVHYTTDSSAPKISVGLRAAAQFLSAEEKKLISSADAVVLALGFNSDYESEGYDRPFELPWGQEALLHSVVNLNSKTIVDIQAGGAVDAHTWVDRVPALMQSWYPGQSGGSALARVLFGERSPEGKLPMSWEKTLVENPAYAHYYEQPGSQKNIPYEEKLNLGYRYYVTAKKQPLFPFGFGLSYTTFQLSNLKVSEGKEPGLSANVTVEIKNKGSRPGAEVVQLYVGNPGSKIERPAKELKGFAKVRLAPGETQSVSFSLDKRAFSFYDTASQQWQVDPGAYVLSVSTSSQEEGLKQNLAIGQK